MGDTALKVIPLPTGIGDQIAPESLFNMQMTMWFLLFIASQQKIIWIVLCLDHVSLDYTPDQTKFGHYFVGKCHVAKTQTCNYM